MDTITTFGAQYLWLLSPLLALWYFYKLPKKRNFLISAGIILPAAFLLGLAAKSLWQNPSPIDPLENGFPSDHTLLVSAIAALITRFDKRLSALLWIIAGVVAASRVLAGEHHAIDVVASIVISLLSLAIAYAIIAKLWKQNNSIQEKMEDNQAST